MTAKQFILMIFISIVFMLILVALYEILDFIDNGEYKKALIVAIFVMILTIIVFAGILAVF